MTEKPRRTQIDIGGIRDQIERLAKEEKRSVAAMLRVLLEEALEARERNKPSVRIEAVGKPKKEVDAVTEILIWDTDDLASKALIPPERIDLIQRGEEPTIDELIKLARLFKFKPSELKKQFEEKVPYGCSR